MPKGGYQIISMKNINLTTAASSIPGIYERFESLNGKPALITDLVIGGVNRSPIYATVRAAGTTYAFPVSISSEQLTQILVNQGDTVRIRTGAYTAEQAQPANE